MPIDEPSQPNSPRTARHAVELGSSGEDADRLHALACLLLRDTHRADDAVQETMLAALSGSRAPVRDSSAWLRGVLRRVTANARRRDHVRRQRETTAVAVEHQTPEWHLDTDGIIDRERDEEVARAVAELDGPFRDVVRLTYFEDLDSVEVANRLGIPAATVRTRLHRARATLRQRLSARYGPAAVAVIPWTGHPKWLSPTGASTGSGSAVGLGLSTSAKVAASVVLSLSLVGAFIAADLSVDASPPSSIADEAPIALVMSPAQDAVARAQAFPSADPQGVPAVGDSLDAPDATTTPFRSDRRARLARFESDVRPPFLRYHELPSWLRRHAPRYGLFMRRAEGDIAILDLRDERGKPVLIAANVRHLAEEMLFEYDAQLVAQETYAAHRIAAGEARVFGPGSIPVVSASDTQYSVIVNSHPDGSVVIVEVDDEFRADRVARADRLDDLRHRLGLHRAVFAVTTAVTDTRHQRPPP